MKYVCKTKFEINHVLVGNVGDVLEITDAVPKKNEEPEDLLGYIDIKNLTSNKVFEATWNDVFEAAWNDVDECIVELED